MTHKQLIIDMLDEMDERKLKIIYRYFRALLKKD